MDPVFAMAESDSFCWWKPLGKSMLIAGVNASE